MITDNEIIEIGKIGKPHGVQGEMNMMIDDDVNITSLQKIVLEIDGIYVPFFIKSLRPKRSDTVIVALDDIDNEEEAGALTNLTVYALKADDVKQGDDDEGMYASDLIGFTLVHADGKPVGKITDVNDTTDNALFIVELGDGRQVYIPIADDLIDDIDTEKRYIVMSLPEGIIDLQ